MRPTEQQTRLDNSARTRDIIERGIPEAWEAFEEQGYGIDSYPMALAYVAGKHLADASYVPKLDTLYNDHLDRKADQ